MTRLAQAAAIKRTKRPGAPNMKIAIIGVGAMGSIYAGMLSEAGHEVWAIDPWAAHVAAINADGLRLSGASGDRVINALRASVDISQVGQCDICVIATKASGVAAAAKAIAPVIGPDCLVLTIQNGLGADRRLAQHMPMHNVLLGVADGFGASMKGPGHAHHNAMKLIRIGEITGGISPRLSRPSSSTTSRNVRHSSPSSGSITVSRRVGRMIWRRHRWRCSSYLNILGSLSSNCRSCR